MTRPCLEIGSGPILRILAARESEARYFLSSAFYLLSFAFWLCSTAFYFYTFELGKLGPMGKLSVFCLMCLLTVASAFAQVDTGTIAGSVRDSQGAQVAAATVTFVGIATNVATKTQTDGSGEYVSPPLRPGDYRVVAEAQGFKTETRTTVTLKVQDRLRVDFEMAVGSVSENVEVNAETPTIQTETSSLGQVVTATQITELPLNGRDYIQLATLSTGVVRTSSGTNGNSGGSSTGGAKQFRCQWHAGNVKQLSSRWD